MRASFLLPALLLAACSRHEAPGPTAPQAPAAAAAHVVMNTMSVPAEAKSMEGQKPLADELMQVLFGEHYVPERGTSVIEMDDGQGGTGLYVVRTLAATKLDDGRTVVIANAAESDEAGNDLSGHVSSGVLNVYFLKREGGEWTVLERREHADELGSSGSIGSVSWAMVGPGRPGFIVSTGGTWQGSTILSAAVYELADGVRSLGAVSEHSDNAGACMPDVAECWDIGGHPRFVANQGFKPGTYWDIQVDYSGKRYTVTETPDGKQVEHLKAGVRQTALYRYDGKAYQLVSGADPVPGI